MPACHKVLQPIDIIESSIQLNQCQFLAFGDKLTGTVAEGKDIVQIAQFLRRKSGEAFPVELTVTIHKEKGEVVSATGIIRDITERCQAEQALRESEEKFRSLVIPRKATNCGFSPALNINSCVAQACNSLLFRAFAPCS